MRAVDNFELIRRFMRFESTDQFYFMQILQRKKDGPGPNGIVCGTNNKACAMRSQYPVHYQEWYELAEECVKQFKKAMEE